jgi:hypothetical protein
MDKANVKAKNFINIDKLKKTIINIMYQIIFKIIFKKVSTNDNQPFLESFSRNHIQTKHLFY